MGEKLRGILSSRKMATNDITGCGALIFSKSTKRYLFLLRENSKHDNTWGLVGGKIEINETILQGLTREINEELGGEILDAKILPLEKYTSDNNKFTYHTFLIKVDEEFTPMLNKEHKGYCWTRLEDCPKPMHPGLEKTLKLKNILEKLKLHETIID